MSPLVHISEVVALFEVAALLGYGYLTLFYLWEAVRYHHLLAPREEVRPLTEEKEAYFRRERRGHFLAGVSGILIPLILYLLYW